MGKTIIAPRQFELEGYVYHIHIVDWNCQYVELWVDISNTKLTKEKHNVVFAHKLKLYSNTKGLYFNFRKSHSDNKIIKVYICD